jgi:soluble lytic murein transglycosylase
MNEHPKGPARGGRGYWISPEQGQTAADAPRPERGQAVGPARARLDGGPPGRPGHAVRPKTPPRRRKVLLGMGLSLFILVGLAIVAVLTVTGEVVMPGVSAKLFPLHYQTEIAHAAGDYGQDPYLVAAMVRTESGFDAQAESPAGAVGLMQLMPSTAEWVASKSDKWSGGTAPDLRVPADNLDLGVWYLNYLGEIYGAGSMAALAAYNAGLGHVDDWIAAAGGLEAFDVTDIPYPETKQYVQRVEHYRDLYLRIHPDAFHWD